MVWWIPDIPESAYWTAFFRRRSVPLLVAGGWAILLWQARACVVSGHPWRYAARALPFVLLPGVAVSLVAWSLGRAGVPGKWWATAAGAVLWWLAIAGVAFVTGAGMRSASASALRNPDFPGWKARAAQPAVALVATSGLLTVMLLVGQSPPASRVHLNHGTGWHQFPSVAGFPHKLTITEPQQANRRGVLLTRGLKPRHAWCCSVNLPPLPEICILRVTPHCPECVAAVVEQPPAQSALPPVLHLWLAVPDPGPGEHGAGKLPGTRIIGNLQIETAFVLGTRPLPDSSRKEAIFRWPGREFRISRTGRVAARIWSPPAQLGGAPVFQAANYCTVLRDKEFQAHSCFQLGSDLGPRPFFRDFKQYPTTQNFKYQVSMPRGTRLVDEKGIDIIRPEVRSAAPGTTGTLSLCAPLPPVTWHLDFELNLPPPGASAH